MSDETKVEVGGQVYDVLRVPIDREVLIVTGVRPAVFDAAGNCTDMGLDIAQLGADGEYHPAPVRIIASAIIPAGTNAGIAFGDEDEDDEA